MSTYLCIYIHTWIGAYVSLQSLRARSTRRFAFSSALARTELGCWKKGPTLPGAWGSLRAGVLLTRTDHGAFHMHIYICTYLYVCTCIYIYISLSLSLSVCLSVCVCIYRPYWGPHYSNGSTRENSPPWKEGKLGLEPRLLF